MFINYRRIRSAQFSIQIGGELIALAVDDVGSMVHCSAAMPAGRTLNSSDTSAHELLSHHLARAEQSILDCPQW
jgi:hypothetical protein